jgi:hypothetical protein
MNLAVIKLKKFIVYGVYQLQIMNYIFKIFIVKCSLTIEKKHQSFPDVLNLLAVQHVSGVFLPIIRSPVTAVAASGYTFISW